MAAEQAAVQGQEAARVVDELLIGELGEVGPAGDEAVDLIAIGSQLGEVVAREQLVEVVLQELAWRARSRRPARASSAYGVMPGMSPKYWKSTISGESPGVRSP